MSRPISQSTTIDELMWLAILFVILLSTKLYPIFLRSTRVLCHTYFRKVGVYGINNLPREGPVILCANHPNMLVDAALIISECYHHGRNPYIWVKGSLFANPVVAFFLRKLGALPVYRPKKENQKQDVDTNKSAQEITAMNSGVFELTWRVLAQGHLMLLFPEGTSYTAPKMLDLRTGVIRLAFGFVQNFEQPISIVPVGLTYHNKDSFRSHVVMEFGDPLIIRATDCAYVKHEEDWVRHMTTTLKRKMYDVTLNASDFKIIQQAHMMRRLYLDPAIAIDACTEIRFTQKLVDVLEHDYTNDDDLNAVLNLRKELDQYQKALSELRIKDQDIVILTTSYHFPLFRVLCGRLLYLAMILPLSTPGFIINYPLHFVGELLDRHTSPDESKSMFKLMTAAFVIPLQWILLTCAVWFFFDFSSAMLASISLPVFMWAHIHVLEESRTFLDDVQFILSLTKHSANMDIVRAQRRELSRRVKRLVGMYADKDFMAALTRDLSRTNSANSRLRRESRSEALL